MGRPKYHGHITEWGMGPEKAKYDHMIYGQPLTPLAFILDLRWLMCVQLMSQSVYSSEMAQSC